VIGEITFYLGIFLLGKEFLVKLKEKFSRKKYKSEEPTPSHDENSVTNSDEVL